MSSKFLLIKKKESLIWKSSLLLILLCLSTSSFAQQLAFPEAEGFGRFATGGRSGNVYYVTRLDDCTDANLVEGTLRWAIRTGDDTPRTILFKVGGTINLTSVLKFAYSNVSILGQSAPGGGICVSGQKIYVSKSNVIIRYMRFRVGDGLSQNGASLDIENVQNVIIDHCSFSWSMEENVTMYDNKNTTLQWCILSEPLYNSIHNKGPRAYGAQWGGENSSYHHNIFAHCVSRIPRVNGVRSSGTTGHDFHVDSEIINNVIFNCGSGEVLYGGEVEAPNLTDAYCRTNLINNYFKSGPTTSAKSSSRYFATIYHTSNATNYGQWYIDGNIYENNSYVNRTGTELTSINSDNWYLADGTNSKRSVSFKTKPSAASVSDYKLNTPSATSEINTTNASTAYNDVIAKAGARLPVLDEVDARILAETAGKQDPVFKGSYAPSYIGVIDSQNNLKPANADDTWTAWPNLSAFSDETILTDTDGDGMPDDYETANGFNPTDPADGIEIALNGYSNLENYLNGLFAATVVAPYNLVAKYNTTTLRADITWLDASDNETGFILERALATDGLFVQVAQLGANVTSYSDEAVLASEKYIYRLKSINNTTQSGSIRTTLYASQTSSFKENSITGLKVYPNPIKDILNIETKEEISNINIIDLSGKLIQNIDFKGNKITISTNDYPQGIYFVKVKSANENQSTLKIVK